MPIVNSSLASNHGRKGGDREERDERWREDSGHLACVGGHFVRHVQWCGCVCLLRRGKPRLGNYRLLARYSESEFAQTSMAKAAKLDLALANAGELFHHSF
jgi:hypothetical protein